MRLPMNQEAFKNNTPRNPIRASTRTRSMIVVLTILLSAVAGMAGLFYSSNYAPIIIAGAVIALILFVVFMISTPFCFEFMSGPMKNISSGQTRLMRDSNYSELPKLCLV